MNVARTFYLLVVLLWSVTDAADEKLLLVLVDGLRWDYMDIHKDLDLSVFKQLFNEGVRAEYMVSAYPTVSFPNYFSILTGLYPESHGIIGNQMYDEKRNTTFRILSKESVQYENYWYNGSEPIWVTAEKQNLHTSWYYWLGSDVSINGVSAYKITPFGEREPTLDEMKAAFKSAVHDLSNNSISVVGIHVHAIDENSHRYGFESAVVNQDIQDLDSMLQNLLTELDGNDLSDKVNLMVFSDHGHVNWGSNKLINISEVVDKEDIQIWLEEGALMYIWPKEDKVEKVYLNLKTWSQPNLHVYRKEEIPERLHLKNNPRMPPIFLKADLPWYIITADTNIDVLVPSIHGYDTQEEKMRATFAAKGPAFKKNYKLSSFENVCLYNVMCRILNIEPKNNNGSWTVVGGMLSSAPRLFDERICTTVIAFLTLSLLVLYG